jgi:hypothetical protein
MDVHIMGREGKVGSFLWTLYSSESLKINSMSKFAMELVSDNSSLKEYFILFLTDPMCACNVDNLELFSHKNRGNDNIKTIH